MAHLNSKKRHSIKASFALIAIAAILISALAVFFSTYFPLSGLVETSIEDHIADLMDNFQIEVDYDLERAEAMAARIAEYDPLIDALEANDVDQIAEILDYYHTVAAMETDDVNVTNMNGDVIYCYLHGETGTNLADTDTVGGALGGTQTTAFSTGPVISLGARSAAPVKNAAGKQIGVVRVTYSFEDNELVDEVKDEGDSEFTIFLGDERLSTTIKGDNGERLVGTKMSENIADIVLNQKQEYIGEAVIQGNSYTSMYRPIIGADGSAIGALFAGVLTSEFKSQEFRAVIISALISLLAVVVSTVCIIRFTNRSVIKPVIELVKDTELIAGGDLRVDIQVRADNELGALADSLRTTVESLRGYVEDISVNLNAMAARDMTIRVEKEYIGDFAPIKNSFQKISDSLNSTLSAIDVSAEQVSAGSGQVSSGAQALAQGAAEQASAIQELDAAINGISTKINATAQNAKTAEEENRVSSNELATCSGHMDDLVAAMQVIDGKSKEISNVIKTIEDIAFQTNILALNAAVEAARAGAAGKGFAVVADEVRNLANKSQEAAQSTTVLIDETVQAVAEGTRLSGATEASLKSVVSSARKVLDAVTLISDAVEEQANAVAQISTGIDQISSVVQTNSATAEESAAASEELSGQASMLRDEISRFKLR